jgi:iron complex outermembrane receptor protein
VSASVDLETAPGLYASASLFRYGAQYLNDANTETFDPYTLLNLKGGVERDVVGGFHVHAFVGVNNALDAKYSGLLQYNNSFGEYFNPAPGANWFAGLGLRQSF